MKDKIIEAAGKTWKTLGEQGEANIDQLSKILKEKEAIVYQALGWLAREDKINYSTKNNKTFVSLVENELRAFNNTIEKAQAQVSPEKTNSKRKIGF